MPVPKMSRMIERQTTGKKVTKNRGPEMGSTKIHDKDRSLEKRSHYVRTKLLCRECKAVYDGKSWHSFSQLNPRDIDELKMSICPACHEKTGHLSDGVIHLRGSGLQKHLQEIKNLIVHMGMTAEGKDILDRVERIDEEKDGITVYTTKNQLAVRIGKKISDSYKGGKLQIKWSKDDKPVEVLWRYDK